MISHSLGDLWVTESFLAVLKGLIVDTQEGKDAARNEVATLFAKCFHAYLECDEDIQAIIRDMVEIMVDPSTDDDERHMAMLTLAEALFPQLGNEASGMSLEKADAVGVENAPDGAEALEELDAEEASFAERLGALMDERGLTQTALAEKAGVGQPAISMMLKRECRPQKRTVRRLAEALGVRPEDLWPVRAESRS